MRYKIYALGFNSGLAFYCVLDGNYTALVLNLTVIFFTILNIKLTDNKGG